MPAILFSRYWTQTRVDRAHILTDRCQRFRIRQHIKDETNMYSK